MKNKKLNFSFVVAFILNCAIVCMEFYSLNSYYISDGIVMFRMFTEDSNIILFFSSLIYVVFGIIKIFKGNEMPRFVGIIRYVASCVISVTVIVVVIQVFFVSKMAEIEMFYQYEMIFHHTLCPLTCLISFFGFEKYRKFRFKDSLFAIIPTFIYSIILIILNILKVTEGPYFFLMVYDQSVGMSIMWFFVILMSSYLVCVIYMLLSNLKHRR